MDNVPLPRRKYIDYHAPNIGTRFVYYTDEDLLDYGAACAAAERARIIEECAKVCDAARARIWEYHDETVKETASNVCTNLATEIRDLAVKGEQT
jgi:hypothetical protein